MTMTTTTEEKTWAEKTLEAMPEILKTTCMTELIDCGFESAYGGFDGLASLVEDEEAGKEDVRYELLQHEVEELTKGLHEGLREDINKLLETMHEIAYMNRNKGAKKMTDILIRFYLRHHLGLQV